MKKRINKYCLLAIIIFSIGVCFGKLFDYGYFILTKEISIIESITLFATIGLAIYVVKILEKEVQDIRIKKDLYIAKISEIETILENIEILIEYPNISYNKIINRISVCRSKKNIFKTIKNNFKQIKEDEFNNFNNNFTNNVNYLRELLTLIDEKDVFVKDDIVTYSNNRVNEAFTKISAIKDILFEIKIRINNL